jgi:hypothetical protein
VLSDVGHTTGKVFGFVHAFTDDVRQVYDGFKPDIPSKNGTPDDWSLPLSATYVVGAVGVLRSLANHDTYGLRLAEGRDDEAQRLRRIPRFRQGAGGHRTERRAPPDLR